MTADQEGFADAYAVAAVYEAADRLVSQSTLITHVAIDPQVQRLAATMASDYSDHRRRLDVLVAELGIPEASRPSAALRDVSTANELVTMIADDPSSRDGIFLTVAIRDHDEILKLVERLLSSVERPELRALIEQDFLHAVRTNLGRARDLQRAARHE